MDPEIVPEPSPEEREAILAALAADKPAADGPGAWGRAALEPEEDQP